MFSIFIILSFWQNYKYPIKLMRLSPDIYWSTHKSRLTNLLSQILPRRPYRKNRFIYQKFILNIQIFNEFSFHFFLNGHWQSLSSMIVHLREIYIDINSVLNNRFLTKNLFKLFQLLKKIEKMDFPILRCWRHNEKIDDQHRPEKGLISVDILKYNI